MWLARLRAHLRQKQGGDIKRMASQFDSPQFTRTVKGRKGEGTGLKPGREGGIKAIIAAKIFKRFHLAIGRSHLRTWHELNGLGLTNQ